MFNFAELFFCCEIIDHCLVQDRTGKLWADEKPTDGENVQNSSLNVTQKANF